MSGFSRYMADIVDFAKRVHASAAYCFVLDGDRGTGGCPIVIGLTSGPEYERRCRELVEMMRRSADLLEADLARQGFAKEPPS